MNGTLVSFEVAKLAKEKKFNLDVRTYYCNEIISDDLQQKVNWNSVASTHISAPTQSLLAKWLREVHKIDVIVIPDTQVSSVYTCTLFNQWTLNNNIYEHKVEVIHLRKDNKILTWLNYENALEEGLLNALQLIK